MSGVETVCMRCGCEIARGRALCTECREAQDARDPWMAAAKKNIKRRIRERQDATGGVGVEELISGNLLFPSRSLVEELGQIAQQVHQAYHTHGSAFTWHRCKKSVCLRITTLIFALENLLKEKPREAK